MLISEEADVLLPSIGAVLPSPFVNKDVPTVKSEARAELMKMFDGDCHVRKLKNSVSRMDSFKHSFVVNIFCLLMLYLNIFFCRVRAVEV